MSYLLVISPNHLSINVEIVFEHDTIYRYTRTDKLRFLSYQLLSDVNNIEFAKIQREENREWREKL